MKESDLAWAVRFIRVGKGFKNRVKIVGLYLLSVLWNRSPQMIRSILDLPVEGMAVEADINFEIRSLCDFFILSYVWEHRLRNLFQFEKGQCFLDVGAHLGKYSLRAGREVGDKGKVIAIEPNRDNFRSLCRNISLNGLKNCLALNIAAYSSDKKITMFDGPDSAKGSIKGKAGKGFQIVEARALDNVLSELEIKRVDFVKIDVEGAEIEVLKGLEKTLRRDKPVLMVEILEKDKDQVFAHMNHLGYENSLLDYNPHYETGLMYCKFERNG